MTVAVHVLVVGGDDNLVDELSSAFDGRDVRADVARADDVSGAVLAARDTVPDVVVADLELGVAELSRLGDELVDAAPRAVLLAAYAPRTLDAQGGASAAILIDAVRGRVRDFLRRPVSSAELDAVLARHRGGDRRDGVPLGRITTFFGNKGGVGKSTVAVNVAASLARRRPGRVLVVDASLQLGVCASAFDLEPETTLVDAARQAARLDPTLLRSLTVEHPCGLEVLAAPTDAVEAGEIDEASLARVLGVARRAYDHVIVDTFPVLDGVALAAIDRSDRVYVVTSSLVPVVSGVARLLEVFDRVGCPPSRRGVVLNHAQPPFAGGLRADDVAARLGCDVDHVVPFDKRALVALNVGEPAVLSSRFGRFRRAIEGIVEEIDAAAPLVGATS